MSAFEVRRVGSPGLLFVIMVGHGQQILSRRKLRKPARCVSCKTTIETGQVAWAEATACAMNRGDRYCDPCVSGEIERHLKRQMMKKR